MRAAFRVSLAAVGLASLAVGAVVAAPVQAQPGPRVFSPSSVWAMDYADDSCRLTRSFSNGDDVVTLVLDRFEPGPSTRVTLATDALNRYTMQSRTRFKFAPAGPEIITNVFLPDAILDDGRTLYGFGEISLVPPATLPAGASVDDQKMAIAQPHRPEDEIRAAQAIDRLEVSEGFTKDIVLQLGSMGPPIQAMQACTSELLTHWGVDVERHRGITRRVVPAEPPQAWSAPSDFPARERRQRIAGFNTVRVMVDETGKPTSCHVQRVSESDGFNKAACALLMEKGKFEPALDAAGQPMASYWVTDFRFLPGAVLGRLP